MRALILFVLGASIVLGQHRLGPSNYWPQLADETSTSSFATSAAGSWGAIGFQATASRTLNELHVSISSVTGSLTTGDLRLALYDDSTGKPGSELEGRNSSGTPATGWNSITGYTTSVTAGNVYWIVFRNMDATPGTNNFSVQRRLVSASGLGITNNGTSGTLGAWMSATSTDSGTNWTRATGAYPVVLVWSDGTTEGIPIVSTNSTTCQIYSSRECGLHIRTGAIGVRITGITSPLNKNGSPTGSLRYRLYEGTGNSRTLLGTTYTTGVVTTSTPTLTTMWFASALTLKPYTWYTLAASETTQSDNSTNRFNVTAYTLRSTYTSLFSTGLSAAPKISLSTDGGSTWADTDDSWAHVVAVLDNNRSFIIPTGGFAQ